MAYPGDISAEGMLLRKLASVREDNYVIVLCHDSVS